MYIEWQFKDGKMGRWEEGREKRMEIICFPKFLEGEPLPTGYLEPPNPYVNPPTRKVDIGALAKYARENGKRIVDLTKEEVALFEF